MSASEDDAIFRIEMTGNMLDLHGESCDEAWSRVRDFLDEHAAMGEEGVRIMHGIGTGALKSMLLRQLPKHPRVKIVRPSSLHGQQDAVLVVLF